MRRVMVMFIAVFMVVFGSAAAFAQSGPLQDLGDRVDGLTGESVEEWTEAATGVRESLDAWREAEPEVEAELEVEVEAFVSDLDALDAAIAGGDLDAIAAAAEEAKVSGAALVAAAEAAGVAQPTVVDTGSGVDAGPNAALIGVAALLALLSAGAFVLRGTVARDCRFGLEP